MMPIDEMTHDELRREIAERLGWRDLDITTWWEESYESDPYEAEILTGTSPLGNTKVRVPNWPEDANAALELCRQIALDTQWVFSLTWVWNEPKPYGWSVFFEHRTDELAYLHLHYGHAATPALACARSALAALRDTEASS